MRVHGTGSGVYFGSGSSPGPKLYTIAGAAGAGRCPNGPASGTALNTPPPVAGAGRCPNGPAAGESGGPNNVPNLFFNCFFLCLNCFFVPLIVLLTRFLLIFLAFLSFNCFFNSLIVL